MIQCFEYGDMLEEGDGISYEVEIEKGLLLPGVTPRGSFSQCSGLALSYNRCTTTSPYSSANSVYQTLFSPPTHKSQTHPRHIYIVVPATTHSLKSMSGSVHFTNSEVKGRHR